jgi:ADP-ribose pyrophosphatase YjhB (NUDIX family)
MPDPIFCTHAGGIVFRHNIENNATEYLLIGPSQERPTEEWLFPKGHLELLEEAANAAVREVLEETGVTARIINALEISTILLTRKTITVQYFLMEYVSQGKSIETRRVGWFPYEKALELLTHEGNRKLLKDAEIKRRGIKK